jgi:hypothetical protein
MTNVYPEIGSSFGSLAIQHPVMCQHLMGKNIKHYGVDHVIWGTDCLWWGSPQWVIDAFKRFQISDDLCDKFGYKKLTKEDMDALAVEVKAMEMLKDHPNFVRIIDHFNEKCVAPRGAPAPLPISVDSAASFLPALAEVSASAAPKPETIAPPVLPKITTPPALDLPVLSPPQITPIAP